MLEDKKFLILGGLKKYNFQSQSFFAYNIKFIDKMTKGYQSYSITEPKYKKFKSHLNSGNCVIIK